MSATSYVNLPRRYANELRNKGQRQKARAFWEYYYDMEMGDYNSIRFYAESWGVSKTTSDKWIGNFKEQIDIYQAAWQFKNERHYSHAKNQGGQSGQQGGGNRDSYEPQEKGVCEDTGGQSGQQGGDKVYNLNNNNIATHGNYWSDPQFNDLFFIYSMNTKFKGRKEDAYTAYVHVDVDTDLLKLAAVQYLHDPDTAGKRYNLANFLNNQTYLSYMPKHIRLLLNGEWIAGTYDDMSGVFKSADGMKVGSMDSKRLVERFKAGELEFIRPGTIVGASS